MRFEGRLARSDMKVWRSVFVLLLIMIHRHGENSVVFIKLTTQNKWKAKFIAVNIPEA
jgi:hypothetical protein